MMFCARKLHVMCCLLCLGVTLRGFVALRRHCKRLHGCRLVQIARPCDAVEGAEELRMCENCCTGVTTTQAIERCLCVKLRLDQPGVHALAFIGDAAAQVHEQNQRAPKAIASQQQREV